VAEKQTLLAHRGLTLPKNALRRLKEVGIFAQAHVSLEHQHVSQKYVVRGVESGGAVRELGRYVTFCGLSGEQLPYLHLVDALGVNGVHAVVIAAVLIRIELFRTGRTCQLLISEHKPGQAENGTRLRLEGRILFRGVNGFLETDRLDERSGSGRSSIPRFWSRAGEEREVPVQLVRAVQAATEGTRCIGCGHAHYSISGDSSANDKAT
jgi:hypothetical protein